MGVSLSSNESLWPYICSNYDVIDQPKPPYTLACVNITMVTNA